MSIFNRISAAVERGRPPELADLQPTTDKIEEILARGADLQNLVASPGWKHVMLWIGDRCDEADLRLISLESADPYVIIGTQRRARAWRELHDKLQAHVIAEIQEAEHLRAARKTPTTNLEEDEPIYG